MGGLEALRSTSESGRVQGGRVGDTDGQQGGNGAAQGGRMDTGGQMAEVDRYRRRVQELERERDRLWGLVDSLTRALPPARDEQTKEEKLSWWQRVLRR